jgi:hypothetical protein
MRKLLIFSIGLFINALVIHCLFGLALSPLAFVASLAVAATGVQWSLGGLRIGGLECRTIAKNKGDLMIASKVLAPERELADSI